MSDLKQTIAGATTSAMKARDKQRVAALRLVNAEIKRVEVDDRVELDDRGVLEVLTRMLKQRQDALTQFEQAGREDLAEQERFEIAIVREFMPQPLSDDEIEVMVVEAIDHCAAQSMKDMGAVMGHLKQKLQGRADMAAVSARVKSRLAD